MDDILEQAKDECGQVGGAFARRSGVTDSRLLWRLCNQSTLDTLRGKSRGQYDIRLGRSEAISNFFSDLPRIIDHEGSRIKITTERLPIAGDDAEIPPYELGIRQMSGESIRSGEWYIRAQRPESAYPLWRPGAGPTDETIPDTDFVLLLRTASNRFYAGWLRGSDLANAPSSIRQRMRRRAIDVATIEGNALTAVMPAVAALPHPEIETAFEIDLGEEIEQGLTEAYEGRERTVKHVQRERSRRLRIAKITATGGRPSCEACGFDFESAYGERGRGFIECHHLIPVAQLDPATPTRLDDLALLCANCHRMIHAKQPWLTVEDLRQLLG